jgi:hypothetical protein
VAVGPPQLPLERPVLRLETIQPMLLALGQTVLILNPARPELLTLGAPVLPIVGVRAVGAQLCHAVLRADAVRTILLALHDAPFGMRPNLASLLMLGGTDLRALSVRVDLPAFRHPVLCMMPVRTNLLARLRAYCIPMVLDARPGPLRLAVVLGALTRRALRMALGARLPLDMRRPIAAGMPLGCMSVLSAATMVRLGLMALAVLVSMRPRAGRSCDRHRSDSCGEKQPGHHNISFQREKTARRTSPFQPVNGRNPQASAPA